MKQDSVARHLAVVSEYAVEIAVEKEGSVFPFARVLEIQVLQRCQSHYFVFADCQRDLVYRQDATTAAYPNKLVERLVFAQFIVRAQVIGNCYSAVQCCVIFIVYYNLCFDPLQRNEI